jgi:hypothetical protein
MSIKEREFPIIPKHVIQRFFCLTIYRFITRNALGIPASAIDNSIDYDYSKSAVFILLLPESSNSYPYPISQANTHILSLKKKKRKKRKKANERPKNISNTLRLRSNNKIRRPALGKLVFVGFPNLFDFFNV